MFSVDGRVRIVLHRQLEPISVFLLTDVHVYFLRTESTNDAHSSSRLPAPAPCNPFPVFPFVPLRHRSGLSDPGERLRATQTLSSFTSYPPSSLVLSTPSAITYKLILAYAIPVYPAHWAVGTIELIISSAEVGRMVVTNVRTTRAIDILPGWIDENKMHAVREQWRRKVARVADTQTDDKWVVLALAPGQNLPLLGGDAPDTGPNVPTPHASPSASTATSSSSLSSPASSSSSPAPTMYVSSSMHSAYGLQLYRLHLPASPSSTSLPRLTFVRTLYGQLGPVSTLALSDGRCVSLGVNGSIWVWDLEAGTGTEVSAGVTEGRGSGEGEVDAWEGASRRLASGARGAVDLVFDDMRIVRACGAGVEVRRFDA